MKIKEVNIKPKEKAIKYGIDYLTDYELLAILLNTGTKECDVLSLSEDIINKIGKITNFIDLSYQELLRIKGIGKSKALLICSSIELGKRIYNYHEDKISFDNPNEVFLYMKEEVKFYTQEHFYAIYVDSKGQLIDKRLISIGNVNSVICDTSEIFKWYFKYKSSGFYLIHNHPSSVCEPSIEDRKVTECILNKCKILGVCFVDHIIIGDGYYSFYKDSNLFKL